MYIDVVPNRDSPPAVLLREAWREGKKTRKRTLANLSDWPKEKIENFRRVLRDERLVSPEELFATQKTLPHGPRPSRAGNDRQAGAGSPDLGAALSRTRLGRGHDCATADRSLLKTSDHARVAHHHAGRGIGSGRSHRG